MADKRTDRLYVWERDQGKSKKTTVYQTHQSSSKPPTIIVQYHQDLKII